MWKWNNVDATYTHYVKESIVIFLFKIYQDQRKIKIWLRNLFSREDFVIKSILGYSSISGSTVYP